MSVNALQFALTLDPNAEERFRDAAETAARVTGADVAARFAAANFISMLKKIEVVPIRSTRIMGRVIFSKNRLELTELPLEPGNLEDTFLHEVAHVLAECVVHAPYPRKGPHDKWWRLCATLVGARPRARNADSYFAAAANELRRQSPSARIVARCTGCGLEIIQNRPSKTDWSKRRHRTPECRAAFENVD